MNYTRNMDKKKAGWGGCPFAGLIGAFYGFYTLTKGYYCNEQ